MPVRLRPRLEVCLQVLRRRGYEVVVGSCMDGEALVSAPAGQRAHELMEMLTDPTVKAVIPPWGGELAVEVLPHLDFDELARAAPTWLIGYSDIRTLLLPLTTRTATATLHGQNLMDTPYRVPSPLMSWPEVVSAPVGSVLTQGQSQSHWGSGHDDWETDPAASEYTLDTPGGWRPLDPSAGQFEVSGRLIGGCIETVSILAGTAYGDLAGFVQEHAPEGLLVYVEASEDGAVDIARHLWRMRLAGWFDAANAVLVGRTSAPYVPGFTQEDAVRSALAGLDVPVVLDVDCGHVPPHLALVNGALGHLTLNGRGATLTQRLVE